MSIKINFLIFTFAIKKTSFQMQICSKEKLKLSFISAKKIRRHQYYQILTKFENFQYEHLKYTSCLDFSINFTLLY